jgi:hypothetical protein
MLVVCLCFLGRAVAQDDLLGDLIKEDSVKPKHNLTIATFKSTRVINMQSVELTGKGNLQFMISHHFANIWNSGAGWQNVSQFFGLNAGFANTYLSFDYSPKSWLNFGVAMTGNSMYEGWAKARILRQQTGIKDVPVSMVWLGTMNVDATAGDSPNDFVWNRFAYVNQLLIARKFNENFSLQFIPSYIHYNYVPYGSNNTNNIFSLGIGGNKKLGSKTSLSFEYSRQLNGYKNQITKSGQITNFNPDLISLGYNWDTGGHLFQFYISSTTAATNLEQLSRNTSNFKEGNFALGFTLNRSYSIKKVVQTP